MIGFLLHFLTKFGNFFIDQVFGFFSYFLIEFRKLFHSLNTWFFPQFPIGFKRFFFINKAIISNAIYFLKLVSKKKVIIMS